MTAAGSSPPPVRVARVIARLNVGGPAIHATLLSERLDPSRYQTMLVAGSPEPGEADYLALYERKVAGLVRVPALGRELGFRDLAALGALIRVFRRVRPHIVHTHTAKAGTLGRLAARACRVPLVVHTYHGHVLRGYFSPMKTAVFRGIERALARMTDRLVAVSPSVRDELRAMHIGREEQFAVIPLGFDLDRFATADRHKGAFRQELGVAPGTPLVGIVARLVPIKAHEVFVAAAALLRAELPGARFVVVGDGECRPALEAQVHETGLAGCVRFLGWRGDLERIYADLDVVMLTSRNEGSPVALIEAMASGCPVVATRVGGVPDVVSDGDTGCLVAMDDVAALAREVRRLIDAPERRLVMASRARASVLSRYGADRLVQDVSSMYDALIEGHAWST